MIYCTVLTSSHISTGNILYILQNRQDSVKKVARFSYFFNEPFGYTVQYVQCTLYNCKEVWWSSLRRCVGLVVRVLPSRSPVPGSILGRGPPHSVV